MCHSCDSKYFNLTTPERYNIEIEKAVQRIKKSVPNVLVNLCKQYNSAC